MACVALPSWKQHSSFWSGTFQAMSQVYGAMGEIFWWKAEETMAEAVLVAVSVESHVAE